MESKAAFPIIDIHASWIAFNPIYGCPNSCKYCFLNKNKITRTAPQELVSPEEAVNLLLSFYLYSDKLPLALFTSTDAFATPNCIRYTEEVLKNLYERNIKNTIVFITKCRIPEEFIIKLNKYEQEGMKFIFIISYSGLNDDIERGINKQDIKNNFINLKKYSKKIIHFWRPFLPQNSSDETINEVLNFVKNYATCSVATGLKVQEEYINNLSFWKELIDNKELAEQTDTVWTENAFEKVYKHKGNYSVFKTTSCALAFCAGDKNNNGYYNSDICLNYNNCPLAQREICKMEYEKNSINQIEMILINNCKKLNLKKDSWSIDLKANTIFISQKLKTSEVVYLKLLTNMNVISEYDPTDYYWGISRAVNKILILK